MLTKPMRIVISAEYLFAAILTTIIFVVIGGFDWWWLIVLFVAFDLSMIGYLFNNRIGAFTYNVDHSLIGPIISTVLYILTSNQSILFVTLLWLFHIFVDRALGYGLKHTTSFQHTHMGTIGKSRLR